MEGINRFILLCFQLNTNQNKFLLPLDRENFKSYVGGKVEGDCGKVIPESVPKESRLIFHKFLNCSHSLEVLELSR